jgi:hypothetical protein
MGGVAAGEAAAVVQVQQQAGRAHRAVVGAGSLAFHAALVALGTVKFLSLWGIVRRFLVSAE